MPTRDLADMTWEEARDAARARSVALLPVGAIEAHGPHLPLGTDLIIADAWVRAGADLIAGQGYNVFRLPPVAYTPAPFGRAFPGTISVDPASLTVLVANVASELARHGVAALGVANAHLDPANVEALRAAVARCRDLAAPVVAIPDITRKPWALRLGEEFRTGACHAGRFESSIVLAARPDLVRDEIRHLPPNPVSLSAAIGEGKRTFEEAGGGRAYFGWPADATAEEGRAHIAALGAILADAVLEALAPEPAA
jgi:creatinine amidohydrolase